MQSFMVHSFEQIAEEAARLTRYSKRKTLTAREVQVSGQQGVGVSRVCTAGWPYVRSLLLSCLLWQQ